MTAFQINEDEREALRGLPMLAREIYVFGLRPFMDYASGVVGVKRGVSWKSIAEELYVEPHQGIKGGEPTEKELRRALTWLQKAGLLSPNQAERRLVFELQLATRDQSARNKVGSKWADEAGREAGRPKASNDAGLMGKEGGEVGGGESRKVGTPPESGNHTVPLPRATDAQPATAGQWCQFFIRERRFQLHVVQTPKTMPLFASWVERGVTADQVRTAMEIAEAKLGNVPDSPMYYRNFLDQLLLEHQQLASQQEHRHERDHRPGQSGQGGPHRGPGSLADELLDTTWAERITIPDD